MAYTENEVFRMKEKPEDENEWPAFTLNHVVVVPRDDGTDPNLLEATAQQPVTIIGRLEPPGLKLKKLLLTKPPAQPWVLEIDCTHYSYGIYDNGDIDIWAAGDAGWFLINPDSSFKKTYQDMIAAVRLFYHMADAYKEDKKTRVEDILKTSAKAMQMPMRKLQDLFTRYVRFFGIQMGKGAEIGSWSRTTLYQYMKEQHPEALPGTANGSKKRATSKPKHEPEAEPSRAGLRSRADVAAAKQQPAVDANAPKKPVKTGRAARYENVSKNKVMTPEPDTSEQRETAILEAELLWKGIQKAVKQSEFNRDEASISAVSQELLSVFDLEDELQAADYIRLHAPGLVAIITGLTSRKDSWQKSKFWAELNAAKLPRSTAAKLRQLQIQPHDDANFDDSTNYSDDSEESDPKTPVRGKGTLRLVSGKKSAKRYTGKSKGKGKMRVIEVDDEDEDVDMEVEDEVAGHVGDKRKAPRDNPPARKSKRLAGPFIQSDSDDEEEAEEEEELPAMDGAADDNNATSVDAIPFKKDLLLDMNIDIERGSSLSRPDQSLDPDDASDVWHCKHDGCMETVYGASKDKHQRIIREHLDSHDNMIKAVLGEQAMTHKPVGNLLRLLREKAGGYPEALAMLEGNSMGFAAPVATMM